VKNGPPFAMEIRKNGKEPVFLYLKTLASGSKTLIIPTNSQLFGKGKKKKK
jgi:hypothetical protein